MRPGLRVLQGWALAKGIGCGGPGKNRVSVHRAADGGSGGEKRGTPSSGHAEGEGGREAVHRASLLA